MRVLVTGADTDVGEAIVHALLQDDHPVRLFGVGPEVAERFKGEGTVQWFPGRRDVTGSIEPVLAEREVLIDCGALRAPGKDKEAHAFYLERGALACRYGAEREQVELFVYVTPTEQAKGRFKEAHDNAEATVRATRGHLRTEIIVADAPSEVAAKVVEMLRHLQPLGKPYGRNDAVTA